MADSESIKLERTKKTLISVAIFFASVAAMAWLRLHVYPDRFVTLTYGLPLLVCLLHRDRVLLWSMAVTFGVMTSYKVLALLPDATSTDNYELIQWIFQLINIGVIGGTVHGLIHYQDVLRAKNTALATTNEELRTQGEELAQQNEEIQQQAEELSQQNVELEQQTEELQAQSEELKAVNEDLVDRESMLSTVLKTVASHGRTRPLQDEICEMVLALMGPAARCAAVVEKEADFLAVRGYSGPGPLERSRWPFQNSLAAVAMEQGRTAGVHDLKERPDLIVPRPLDAEFRSSLATPLFIGGAIVGVLEIHSSEPHAWTAREFQLLEWAASQCGLLLEITRLRDELSDRNFDLERLVSERTAKLQELVDDLEHFSYTITHDMRAPLRALQGFAGLLEQECESQLRQEHSDYLKRIVQSAERMDRLITDALSYSRAVGLEHPVAVVNTDRLLRGIISSYPSFQPPGATVEIRGPIPPVLANEAGLTQCLSNLLGNAVKFVEPGRHPRVVVHAESRDGVVRLWVEDNGIGIPAEFQPRLFGMFQRYSKQYDGTGVGLALVRKVCTRMGGSTGVLSKIGEGSRFWIELKAAPDGQFQTATTANE